MVKASDNQNYKEETFMKDNIKMIKNVDKVSIHGHPIFFLRGILRMI